MESTSLQFALERISSKPSCKRGTGRRISGSKLVGAAKCKPRRSYATPEKVNDVEPTQESLQSLSGVVTDRNVPEGHKGLHGLLYGESGAEVHEGGQQDYQFRPSEDDGSTLVLVESYLESRDGESPLGVYALFDSKRNLQYISYARNIILAVKAHLSRVDEEKCTYIRCMVFMNKAMSTRSVLAREAENWLEAAGTLPPGNGVEREIWEGVQLKDLKPEDMSDKELAEYEEKKFKMRKAMGENLYDPVPGESLDSKERRLRMIKAVEGDNWSAVIGDQTSDTVEGKDTQAQQNQIVSPFAQARVHRAIGNETDSPPEAKMTVSAVDKALDEVRPYLISDGGNVEVVSVQDGIVLVEMKGACGGCPSSTATIKMGIERALKASFGDQLQEVVEVGQEDTSATLVSVDAHLDILRPAIEGYGGKVAVSSVDDGICKVMYKGPAPIATGITAALKDKFPDVKEVVILPFEE